MRCLSPQKTTPRWHLTQGMGKPHTQGTRNQSQIWCDYCQHWCYQQFQQQQQQQQRSSNPLITTKHQYIHFYQNKKLKRQKSSKRLLDFLWISCDNMTSFYGPTYNTQILPIIFPIKCFSLWNNFYTKYFVLWYSIDIVSTLYLKPSCEADWCEHPKIFPFPILLLLVPHIKVWIASILPCQSKYDFCQYPINLQQSSTFRSSVSSKASYLIHGWGLLSSAGSQYLSYSCAWGIDEWPGAWITWYVKLQISYQGFSNMAFDWLAAVVPANQMPGLEKTV